MRRSWVFLLLGVGAACAVAGCSGSDDGQPPPVPPPGDAGNGDAGSRDGAVEPSGCLPANDTACDIFVSPAEGSDANPGTKALPVKSLMKALGIARKGQTVHLADGKYDAANGEKWPETVADGVSLEADSPNGAVLEGGKAQDATKDVSGLEFAGSARVDGLSFHDFGPGITGKAGTLEITGIAVDGGDGIALVGTATAHVQGFSMAHLVNSGIGASGQSHVDVKGGNFSAEVPASGICPEVAGFIVGEQATGTIDGVAFSSLGRGALEAVGNASVTVTNSTFTGPSTCAAVQVGIGDRAALTFSDSRVSGSGIGLFLAVQTSNAKVNDVIFDNLDTGIVSYGSLEVDDSVLNVADGIWQRETGAATVRSTKVWASGNFAIEAEHGTTLVVRRSELTSNKTAVVDFTADADLGTAADPGFNTILGGDASLWVQYGPLTAQAVGNKWHPSVQGADSLGYYANPQLLDTVQGNDIKPANFWITRDCKVQL